jgi:hypothetical protein
MGARGAASMPRSVSRANLRLPATDQLLASRQQKLAEAEARFASTR